MSLKTGNSEREAREFFLGKQFDYYNRSIDSLLTRVSLTAKLLDQLDDLYLRRDRVQSELDGLYLQSRGGDVLNEDIAEFFREDVDIDKICNKGVD